MKSDEQPTAATDRTSVYLLAAVVVLAGGLFLVDISDPQGLIVRLPYVVVVLISLWFPQRWQTYATALVCTLLTVLGLYFSPGDIFPFWASAFNRLLGLCTIWIAAFLGLAARRTRQLREANRRLRHEIVERERLQAQLLRNQRLESIGILAGGIAHDFNNLLTPILMSVKFLKEQRPDSERQRILATLQASAERGAEVVRQLLSFTGGSDGQRAPVRLTHVINELKSILDHTFPKTIRIDTHLSGDLHPVLGDVTQLCQVLMNLCVNARDAMPQGGSLTISARNVQVDQSALKIQTGARVGPHVVVTVADSGSGIPAEVIDKIFDPFFTTKEPGKGTGLGLSTALGIVKSHGGFIDVSSDAGRGTCFAVYLPADTSAAHQADAALESPASLGRGELILVVDDEPAILDTVTTTLQDNGYRVITAADGGSALTLHARHRRDIKAVILDMMMPGMDGAATMAALRQVDPDCRIIVSSGLRARGWVAQDIAAGEQAFLQKPYSDGQILTTLARVLNSRAKVAGTGDSNV